MGHLLHLRLRQVLSLVLLGTSVLALAMPATAALPCADLNRDGVVDLSDVAIFSRLWAEHERTGRYYPLIDLNRDGAIDLSDVAIFAMCYK